MLVDQVKSNHFELGPVAQLGARFNRTEEAGGSNPPRSTGDGTPTGLKHQTRLIKIDYHIGPIAQLGARLNGIEKAEGSNPSGSTKFESRIGSIESSQMAIFIPGSLLSIDIWLCQE